MGEKKDSFSHKIINSRIGPDNSFWPKLVTQTKLECKELAGVNGLKYTESSSCYEGQS